MKTKIKLPSDTMKQIKVKTNTSYTLTEELQVEFEAGLVVFTDLDGDAVKPEIFGRSGDGFNVTFNK